MSSEVAEAAGPEGRYLAALAAGRFEIQNCRACGRYVFMPRAVCPHCGGESFEWVSPTGNGVVYATTTVRVNKSGPHNVSIIELEEGVRMMAAVQLIPPDEVAIGMLVKGSVHVLEGVGRVVFQRRDAA